ncbi:MAG: Stk1 family PASTA domain-containing Ser/Thr kinase [Actinomycetota bacterium]
MTHPAPPDGTGGHELVTLDGRYTVLERIAAGGMGEVFLARDTVLAREVAIKVLHRSLSGDQAFVDRFRREARAAAGLSHPNIVAVYDWGAVDGIYYMVMEYVRGRGVRDLLNLYGKLEPAQACEVVRQTLLALGHAHAQGIVHRDIKPENVLVTTDGVVKVADFGLARAYADGRATQAGAVTGTVQYLAPEQIRGEPADPRSDLYSLGIVTYELLTGKLPFTGETAMSIAYKHLSDRVPRPSATVPSIPVELDGFVTSATDRDRELRPESAAEMRRDIEALEPTLPAARSLAALIDDMPEVTAVGDDGERTEAVAIAGTQTQTIPRVERGRRRRWKRVVVAVLVVAALAASAWGAWTYVVPHEAVVPPTGGLTVQQMSAQLTDLGFAVKTAEGQYSMDVPAGQVLKLRPSPGATLDEGATVVIVPSLGPPPVDLPNVVGKPLERAKDLLRSAGLVPVVTKPTFDFDVAAGSVISQDPSTPQAPKGSEVELVVSKGPPPVNLPNVVGKMQDEATKRLEAQTFQVSIVEEFSNVVEEGRVISQSPSGAEAPSGSTITLTVSKGPEQFPAPNFGGLSKSGAQALADQYGLLLVFKTVPGTTGSVVYSQSPGVGVTVRYGDTITLFMV